MAVSLPPLPMQGYLFIPSLPRTGLPLPFLPRPGQSWDDCAVWAVYLLRSCRRTFLLLPAYNTREGNNLTCVCLYAHRGSTYPNWGGGNYPGRRIPTLVGGYLPWPEGYLPWLDGVPTRIRYLLGTVGTPRPR